jgi:hypothetical protein
MEKQQVVSLLLTNHQSFTLYTRSLTDEQFVFAPPHKWSAGQQLQHINLSVRPVVLAMGLPRLLVRMLFGKATNPGKTYDALVSAYHLKLQNGYKASAPYIPKSVHADQKEKLIAALNAKVHSLCSKIESFTESELDTLRLPHPLLGKLTMREMLYFTAYHAAHHEATVKSALAKGTGPHHPG